MSVIWFTIRYRLDELFEVKSVLVQPEDSPALIKANILKAFKQTPNSKLDFKVRNIKGIIVPLNSLIPRNTKLKPYVVQLFVPLVRVTSAQSTSSSTICTAKSDLATQQVS